VDTGGSSSGGVVAVKIHGAAVEMSREWRFGTAGRG
jgi:hypothetical protein